MTTLETENVCFLGKAGVGKTALVERIIRHRFNPRPSPTVGVDFFSVPRVSRESGKYTMFVLVDTSGSKQFEPIALNMLKTSSKVVLCYKHGDAESEQHLIDVVVPAIQERGFARAKFYVVATMSDLSSSGTLRRPSICQQHMLDRGLDVVHGTEALLTSAKTGQGVSELFELVKQQQQATTTKPTTDDGEDSTNNDGVVASIAKALLWKQRPSTVCALL
jgi:GTPase SAR1 family protein